MVQLVLPNGSSADRLRGISALHSKRVNFEHLKKVRDSIDVTVSGIVI